MLSKNESLWLFFLVCEIELVEEGNLSLLLHLAHHRDSGEQLHSLPVGDWLSRSTGRMLLLLPHVSHWRNLANNPLLVGCWYCGLTAQNSSQALDGCCRLVGRTIGL
jgi:hypothetical protein